MLIFGKQDFIELKLDNLLCLIISPLLTCLEAFSGFLGKTKMKADTKLTVVMCCQIFDRRSLAPSSIAVNLGTIFNRPGVAVLQTPLLLMKSVSQ